MNAAVKIADVTAAVDAQEAEAARKAEAKLAADIERLGIEWDLRLAQAIEAVTLARLHDERANDPWSADDAARVRTIADLLHGASGQFPAHRPFTPVATVALVTARKLDARVEQGIAASSAPVEIAAVASAD